MARTTDTERSNAATATVEATAEERLHALLRRIKVGQNIEATDEPTERPPMCRACYQRGWQAALKYLLNG